MEKPANKVFYVTIIKCSKKTYWYNRNIGYTYDVIDNGDDFLRIVTLYKDSKCFQDSFYIQKQDTIILT